MKSNSCFFIGHKDAPSFIYPALLFQTEKLITEHGVHEFYIGHYGSFDAMALRALTFLKQQYPHIRRILVTPYHPSQHPIEKPENCDELYYPFEEPVMPRYAIVRANRKMIDACDYLIAYAEHTGKARDYLQYARRQESRGLIQIRMVETSWERAERNLLLSSLIEQAAGTECFSRSDVALLEQAAFSSEEALLIHCRREFGSSFGTILDQIEKGLPEYLNFIQDHPTSVDPDLFKTLLDFPLYLSQLRRREGI